MTVNLLPAVALSYCRASKAHWKYVCPDAQRCHEPGENARQSNGWRGCVIGPPAQMEAANTLQDGAPPDLAPASFRE
jgi:hypothetical protein